MSLGRRGHGTQARFTCAAIALAILLYALTAQAAAVERPGETPEALKDVGTTERLNEQAPLDLQFTDSTGRAVKLADLFDGKTPILLTLNYSNCPRLCSLQLNGLFAGLEKLKWDLGSQFRMITVSIDPGESPQRAEETKQKYLRAYGREGAAAGWHCLVGSEENIRALADAVGFRYVYVAETKEFAHAAVTMVLTPGGRVSRYLYGIEYDPQTLRLSLVEASEGKVGSTVDKIILLCFHYDSAAGRYAPVAFRIMQIGALGFAAMLGCGLLVYWRRDKKHGTGPATAERRAPGKETGGPDAAV